MLIKDIMVKNVIHISPDDSVGKAINLMEEYRVGGLPVVDNEELVGIITSKDVRSSHPNRLVIDAMVRDVIAVYPDTSIWEAKRLIEKKNIERLPVVEKGKLVGIVTKTMIYSELSKHVDYLTGLHKSRWLKFKAKELLQRGKDIGFIFIDLDDFGLIDKKYGHIFGDKVLEKTARYLESCLEENDYLCRFAGDEFVIITERCLEDSRFFAKSIINGFEKVPWPKNISITASVGISHSSKIKKVGSPEKTVDYLINLASLACSNSKRAKKISYQNV